MYEIVHIAAQKRPLAESEAGHRSGKQMRGINLHKIMIQLLVVGHARNQANTQTKPNIGFDNISVDCGKNDFRVQASIIKGLVQLRATCESGCIGHDGVFSNRLQ